MTKNLIRVLYFSETGNWTPVEKPKLPKKEPVPPEIKNPIHDQLEKTMATTLLEQKLAKIDTLNNIKAFIAEVDQAKKDGVIFQSVGTSLESSAKNKWEEILKPKVNAIKDLAGVKTFIAEVDQAKKDGVIFQSVGDDFLKTLATKMNTFKN